MLSVYLVSIVVWFVLILSYLCVASAQIADNGWTSENNNNSGVQAMILLCCVCAIPILRFIFLYVAIYMSAYTKEEYEEMKNKYKGDDE